MTNSENESLEEVQISSESVFKGVLLDVLSDRVLLPDGKESVREYVRHPGAVAVVAIRDDGRIVFERQFRYPLRAEFLEIPAGKIDPGEDILVCARRELREETGFEATEWKHLGVMHPCIGYSDERIEIFLATGLLHVGRSLDEEEFLEVLEMSPEEATQAVLNGRITDGKTIAALFIARDHLGG